MADKLSIPASGVMPATSVGNKLLMLGAADLYCDIEASPGFRLASYWPGLLVALLATLAALFISEHYGAPATLMALLIGLSLNFLGTDAKLHPGLGFATTRLLRIGIVLLGARVTFSEIFDLGLPALLAITAILCATILSGILFARLLGYNTALGVLAGGAVGICGASAALGLAAVLGDHRINRMQLALVLVGIAIMSAIAMFFYPILAHDLGMTGRQAGFFLGASIHDVAQAIGAGYGFSTVAGQTATIVKLTRVMLLAPVLMIVGMLCARGSGQARAVQNIPWFVLGFLASAALNSAGVVPSALSAGFAGVGSFLVITAVTSAGIRSPVAQIRDSGIRFLLVIIGASLVAASGSVVAALLLV